MLRLPHSTARPRPDARRGRKEGAFGPGRLIAEARLAEPHELSARVPSFAQQGTRGHSCDTRPLPEGSWSPSVMTEPSNATCSSAAHARNSCAAGSAGQR